MSPAPLADPSGAGYDIVVPTIGRPSLTRLLDSLACEFRRPDTGPRPQRVIIVDDRPRPAPPIVPPAGLGFDCEVVVCGGRGPAAARNRGWYRSTAPWVCFVDDDVEVQPGWSRALAHDLHRCDERTAAVQGRVHVPVRGDRRPTDRERNVGGLADARWITADMAVRREALAEIGGFDERFRRAYREDSDLALRLLATGHGLRMGTRRIDHPVGAAPWWISISQQRGNADDALMRRLHGPHWRSRAGAPAGAMRHHIAATASAVVSLVAAVAGRRRLAVGSAAASALLFGRFGYERMAAGPREPQEIATMVATSVAIPPMAVVWALRGRGRARHLAPAGEHDRWHTRRPRLVLFDRDGTLVDDVPYNGDPSLVRPVAGAREALDRLRSAGVRVGIASNQSGVARGLLAAHEVAAVNQRIVELLGPFDTVHWCPHGPDDGCGCRKPATGMLDAAARRLEVHSTSCAFVGDIGTDVEAGLAAGMRTILIPTPVTEGDEVRRAPEVASSLSEAVDALLGGRRLRSGSAAHHAGRTEERVR
jgi:HAD superfamily hydrolase (TIGR01662 family)